MQCDTGTGQEVSRESTVSLSSASRPGGIGAGVEATLPPGPTFRSIYAELAPYIHFPVATYLKRGSHVLRPASYRVSQLPLTSQLQVRP